MLNQSLYHTIKRYRTLQTHRISALPIVILMPHSACNCRCVMCDIWRDNHNLKQLTEKDISNLFVAFKKFGTLQVVISGGEALLNPYPYKKCNAPWVSTVIEADGTVRPCFFHPGLGNIHHESLDKILNNEKAIHFRKKLDVNTDTTCKKCVCYLNLPPRINLVVIN